MKKNVTIREIILLGVLLIAVVYYFAVHRPLAAEMDRIAEQQLAVEEQMELESVRLVTMRGMQAELEALFAEGDPVPLPEYSNANRIMLELNTILAAADSYSIDFGSETVPEEANYVVRRDIQLSFTTAAYDDARQILDRIHRSEIDYLFADMNITDQTLADPGEPVTVAVELVCFEYLPVVE